MELSTTIWSFILVALLSLILLQFKLMTMRRLESPQSSLRDLEDIRNLLDPGPDHRKEHLLAARAIANARFRRAFDLRSTFTSPSLQVHHDFKREAIALFSKSTLDSWAGTSNALTAAFLSSVVHEATIIQPKLDCKDRSGRLGFALWVQSVTLGVVLVELFDVSIQDLTLSELSLVTASINELWIASKTFDPGNKLEPQHETMLSDILARLCRWIPDCDKAKSRSARPFRNPLEFIIPAYETLWRVVATALAYTVSRHSHVSQPAVAQAFREYAANPTMEQFRVCRTSVHPDALATEATREAISVDFIIKEVMRLHPPTRRIARADLSVEALGDYILSEEKGHLYQDEDHTSSTMHGHLQTPRLKVADIEALHRSTAIWGPSAAVFNPARHHHVGADLQSDVARRQSAAYMPFGIGPLSCPAQRWAPARAGSIAAAMATRFCNDGGTVENGLAFRIVTGDKAEIGGRVGWNGWFICWRRVLLDSKEEEEEEEEESSRKDDQHINSCSPAPLSIQG